MSTWKGILIVLDSIGYDLFTHAKTPVIDSIGEVHKAISYGQFTTPSVAAMLVGYLPRCTIPDCYHNRLFEKPFSNIIENHLRSRDVYVFTSNPYVMHLLRPHVFKNNERYHFGYYNVKYPYVGDVVEYLSKIEHGYFCFLHVMCTHDPYYDGNKYWYQRKLTCKEAMEKQKESLSYVDSLLKPIVDDKDIHIIVTADHGEICVNSMWGHSQNIFNPKLFEVPIISRW